MIETARMLRSLFDRSTKVRLLFATLVAVGIAALDAIAVALVLPLVELASGGSRESDITDAISSVVPGLNEENHMVLLTALVVGLFVTKSIASIAYTWWLAGFKARNRALLSARLFQQYLSVPLVQIDTRTRGDLLRTMTEGVTQVFGSSVGALMTMVIQGLTTIFILITMIILEPVGSLALILYFLAGSLLVLRAARHRAAKAGVEAMNAARESISAALAGLGAQREVRLRAAQDYFVGRQLEAGFRSARASRVQEFLSAIPRHAMEILFIGGIGVILLIASGSGGSTIGTLAFFVAAGFRVIPSTTGILGAINNIRFGRAYLDLVLSDAKTLGPDRHPNSANVPATIDRVFNPYPHVEFRRVGFVYPGSETPALKDISFDLPFGHSLGLVGGSGSGKSTLADVLLGLRDASSGEVLVDGEPLSKNLTSWQGMIGFVPQDVFVLEGSLRENVAFGVAPENIDDKKVMGALERSQLGGLVDSLPDGLDSSLGEGGSRLSGGQRQRVGIARALYGDPRILILDEATSALDNQTEYLVSRALEQIRGDVTLVVIAHRLSTVRSMDRLLLLSEGRVGGFGSFEELRASMPSSHRWLHAAPSSDVKHAD